MDFSFKRSVIVAGLLSFVLFFAIVTLFIVQSFRDQDFPWQLKLALSAGFILSFGVGAFSLRDTTTMQIMDVHSRYRRQCDFSR